MSKRFHTLPAVSRAKWLLLDILLPELAQIFCKLGPSLTASGFVDALQDPLLELHDPDGNSITNDDWRSDQALAIFESTIPPSEDAESAMSLTLVPGAYTAIVRGKDDTTGVALGKFIICNSRGRLKQQVAVFSRKTDEILIKSLTSGCEILPICIL